MSDRTLPEPNASIFCIQWTDRDGGKGYLEGDTYAVHSKATAETMIAGFYNTNNPAWAGYTYEVIECVNGRPRV